MKHQVRRLGAAIDSGCVVSGPEIRSCIRHKDRRLGAALDSGPEASGREIRSCIRQWA